MKNNINKIPRLGKKLDYTIEALNQRCDWLEERVDVKIEHLRSFSEKPENTRGNIENPIGMAQIPVGITGPLLINGSNAQGIYFVPMATTEGALITDYSSGMRVVTKSGGLNATVLSNTIHISPAFLVGGLEEAQELALWVKSNFEEIKAKAESTTKHGRLIKITPVIVGRKLVLKFCYDSGDAQGLNMINNATEVACEYISDLTKKKYYLRSKYSSVKIAAPSNIYMGYGREVFVDGVIPREILKLLRTTPEELVKYYNTCLQISVHSGIFGMTAHIANAIAAIYLACGQDIADVSTSHVGISMCEVTEENDLYISLYIPNLLIGTVGGGTGLGTQRECLEILGCYGPNKVNKFAEIIAAACLAGELSVLASIVTGVFVAAHEKMGRNKVV